jgi:small redox-active disulfide protein 2
MLKIKVLGPGCNNCHLVEEVAREAVAAVGAKAEFEKVTERADFARYGLLYTPGLVINEKLVSAGRIPNQNEVMTWVTNALAVI